MVPSDSLGKDFHPNHPLGYDFYELTGLVSSEKSAN